MYAVIRAGGKQYRVAPGDVIRVETQDDKDGKIEFGDVLAVSAEAGSVLPPGSGARREDPGLPLQAQEAI
jgi:large subunit ribosomal protein L21